MNDIYPLIPLIPVLPRVIRYRYHGNLHSYRTSDRVSSVGLLLYCRARALGACRNIRMWSFSMIMGDDILIFHLQVRTFGLSTKSYTLACFTAALTIVGELAFALIQWKKPMPILNMGIFFLVIWVFWLGTSSSARCVVPT